MNEFTKKRCEDCAYLLENVKGWYCDLMCDYCDNIDIQDCDNGVVYVEIGDDIIDVYDNLDDYYKAIGKEV